MRWLMMSYTQPSVIAFDKECLHSAVSFENFGLSIHGHQFGHPEKFFRGEIIQGEWRNFHRACALFLAGVEFHVLSCVLVCFLVKFDLLFVFSVLSRQILACASLFIYVQEHDHLCFPMLTVETAVCDWYDSICWLSSSRDRKVQSYPVEYFLKSVEEYCEGTIHKGEPEPRNGNVNTVYFINQARGNTGISRTEFIYDESMRLQMVTYIWASYIE